MIENKGKFIYLCSAMIIVCIGFVQLLTAGLLLCNISINKSNLFLGCGIACFILYFLLIQYYDKRFLLQIFILTGLIIIILTVIVGKSIDISYDGMAYHKLAVGNLANGWNPNYQTLNEYLKNSNVQQNITASQDMAIWLEHYTKGNWYFAACIYAITANIETGKVIHILLILSAFGMSYSYFLEKTKKRKRSFIISFMISFNPISIAQLPTYYIDGDLSVVLFMILIGLVSLHDEKFYIEKSVRYLVLGSLIVICSNIKFTGLAYAGMFCLAHYLYWMFKKAKKKSDLINYLKRTTVFYFVSVFLAIGIVGSASYVKNFYEHKNPLYPLMGPEKVDIVTPHQPDSFLEMNHYEQFITMLLSKTENTTKEKVIKKIPFEITNLSEIFVRSFDTRRGGFGVFFSGLFIVSLIIILVYLFYCRKRSVYHSYLIIYCCLTFLLIGIVEASWWARYSPYIYGIVIIGNLCLSIYNNKRCKILWLLFSLIIILNNLTFLGTSAKSIVATRNLNNTLTEFQSCSIVEVDSQVLPGFIYNLKDRNINYRITNKIDNPDGTLEFVNGNYKKK